MKMQHNNRFNFYDIGSLFVGLLLLCIVLNTFIWIGDMFYGYHTNNTREEYEAAGRELFLLHEDKDRKIRILDTKITIAKLQNNWKQEKQLREEWWGVHRDYKSLIENAEYKIKTISRRM